MLNAGVCPKCAECSEWYGPRCKLLSVPDGRVYRLIFTCKKCGYERMERTRDAPTPPPENTSTVRPGAWKMFKAWRRRHMIRSDAREDPSAWPK